MAKNDKSRPPEEVPGEETQAEEVLAGDYLTTPDITYDPLFLRTLTLQVVKARMNIAGCTPAWVLDFVEKLWKGQQELEAKCAAAAAEAAMQTPSDAPPVRSAGDPRY